jgi:hypothetical protein
MLEFALLWQCSTNYNINRRRRAWPQRAGSCPMFTAIPASRLNRPPEGAAISSLFEFPSRMDCYFCAIPKNIIHRRQAHPILANQTGGIAENSDLPRTSFRPLVRSSENI